MDRNSLILYVATAVETGGFTIRFKNTTANTGATTLNVNGLGAKPII